MSKHKIPTYDLYVDWQEDPILQGVHKAHANAVIADLEASGANYTLVQSKSIKSSKFDKRRKDRK